MADTYVQFSEGLKVTERDVEFIKKKIAFFETPPADSDSDEWEAFVAECETYEVDDPDHSALEFEIDHIAGHVILYADECGNPYHVAKLVQDLFREHYHDACFTIEWSVSSNRARPGSFGGGALFVTAEKIEAFSTSDWICAKMKNRKGHNPND